MINTILVEDDLYIQKHFVDRLAADGEFHLVGVFRDAFEAEKHCDATVKLVLMDVQTHHKHSGLAAAERIKKAFPQIKIVVATSLVDPEVLQRAKMGAADSLWYKDHGTEELMSVVKRTLAGEKVFPDTAPAIEMEGKKAIISEAASFYGGRIFTLLVEMFMMWLGYSLLSFNYWVTKIVANVVVLILNYVISKLVVFRKK